MGAIQKGASLLFSIQIAPIQPFTHFSQTVFLFHDNFLPILAGRGLFFDTGYTLGNARFDAECHP